VPALWLASVFVFASNQEIPQSEVDLGRKLFFDPILSKNRSLSCAGCHIPNRAFSETLPLSKGFNGGLTQRNTPGLVSASSRTLMFWDGRAENLEAQVMHPITHPVEMGMTASEVESRLRQDPVYKAAFRSIYRSSPTAALLSKAIAAYERSLEWYDAPFDRFMFGDSNALSPAAQRGRELFIGKAGCFDCHFSPDFTVDEYRNIGLFNGKNWNDSGRIRISGKPEDLGSFRVPGLRNLTLTAPYMHNGAFPTLESVVAYYNQPDAQVPDAINRDTLIKANLNLSAQEQADLVAFLKSLTSSHFNP
jgi:cytochrome c peroxidase